MKTIKQLLLLAAVVLLLPTCTQAQDNKLFKSDRPKFNSYIYVGGLYQFEKADAGAKLDLGAGCRINKYLYLGVNVGGTLPINGWEYWGVKTFVWELYSHFSANAKIFVPIKKSLVTPFVDIKLGANIDTRPTSGFYMSYGVGVDYKRWSAMVGYEGIYSRDFDIMHEKNGLGNIIFLNIGVRLGK